MYISQNLTREIDQKKAVLAGNPSYYLTRQKKVQRQLEQDGPIHSWFIEHPRIRASLLLGRRGSEEHALNELIRTGIRGLKEAWHYLSSSTDYLNQETLKKTGALIDPELNSSGYRNRRVTLMMRHTPPSEVKIPALLEEAFYEAKTRTDLHSVEKAARLHLKLAGIQPFEDGNKRASRLMQDRILYGSDLPSAFIPVGERMVYLDLLDQAWHGLYLNEDDEDEQKPFFDYIGGKVNNSLDLLLDDITHKRR